MRLRLNELTKYLDNSDVAEKHQASGVIREIIQVSMIAFTVNVTTFAPIITRH